MNYEWVFFDSPNAHIVNGLLHARPKEKIVLVSFQVFRLNAVI